MLSILSTWIFFGKYEKKKLAEPVLVPERVI
jgi:hypothetical protein